MDGGLCQEWAVRAVNAYPDVIFVVIDGKPI